MTTEPDAQGRPVGITERRTHWLTPLATIGLSIRQFIAPVVLLGVQEGWIGVVIVAGVLLVWRVLTWWRTTFEVGDEVTVRSGVFQRNTTVLPIDRLQEIDIVRSLRHRIVGLTMLRIRGAGAITVAIDALRHDDALAIERLLDDRRSIRRQPLGTSVGSDPASAGSAADTAALPAPVPVAPARAIASVGPIELIVGGLLGAPLAGLALAGAAFGLLDDLPIGRWIADVAEGRPLALNVGIAVCALVVFSSATSLIRHYGLTVWSEAGELRITRGLLDQQAQRIRLERVSSVVRSASVVRRWCGLDRVDIRTASVVATRQGELSTGADVPSIRRDAADGLVCHVLRLPALAPVDRCHPSVARTRAIVRRLMLLVPIATVVSIIGGASGRPWLWSAPPVAIALAIGWGVWWYRQLGHALANGVLSNRIGSVLLVEQLGSVASAQGVVVRQSPTQRRHQLVSLRMANPGLGRGVHVPDISIDAARQLVAELGIGPTLMR